MEIATYENLKKFIERVKNTGFWGWLFNWREIRRLSYDACTEFASLEHVLRQSQTDKDSLNQKISSLQSSLEKERELKEAAKQERNKLEPELDRLRSTVSTLKEDNTKFKTTEESRAQEHKKIIERLGIWEQKLKDREVEIQNEREEEARERFGRLRETWSRHENDVCENIKGICRHHQIEYLEGEKTPFRGRPDNTIVICSEYIIFDAKSPEGEDLSNFPLYIKAQAEAAKKYAKQENVKKDIFLVIPANTSEVIKTRKYDFADFTAWVVTVDSLEPIILTLKKIEEYEFADQLSPDDREQICRMLGKFIHATKRRIQVDQYFWCEFLSALSDIQALPPDFLLKVQQFERATKMNPPQERRAKEIPVGELKQSMETLEQDAKGKGINVGEPQVALIETVPLYLKES